MSAAAKLFDIMDYLSTFLSGGDDRRFEVTGNPLELGVSISRNINDFCLWYLFLFAAIAEMAGTKIN